MEAVTLCIHTMSYRLLVTDAGDITLVHMYVPKNVISGDQ